MDAAKRLLAHPVQKKRPLTIAHVRKIVHKFAQPGAALSTLQMVVLIVLGFAGFLRWSNLAQIRVEQLFFYRSHMSIHLEKCKNDLFCDGQYVHISNSGLSTCPVKLTLNKFLRRSGSVQGSIVQSYIWPRSKPEDHSLWLVIHKHVYSSITWCWQLD